MDPSVGAGQIANARCRPRRWDRILVSNAHKTGQITRRHLLAAGGSAGAAAFVALNPTLAKAASKVTGDPAHLRRATYLALMGQEFSVGGWGSSGTLQLAAISDLPYLKSRDDAFSLTFLGDAATPPSGAAVPLRHPKLGRFKLFLAPVDRATDPQRYEAVINRSRGAKRPRPPKPAGTGVKKHRRRRNVVREAHHHRKHG